MEISQSKNQLCVEIEKYGDSTLYIIKLIEKN